ncbi:DUF6488 family protein [Marinobacter sp. M1N3S26]|uniref:DUF6488 family protein n=1 Tax=unclassified Marinobacter TaxID=83889 RepID=UPI00387B7EBC
MKTLVLICSLVVTLLWANTILAHPNHVVTEPLSDLQVTDRADFLKMQLVASRKLEESWSDVKADAVEVREVNDRRFWIVRYDDRREAPDRFYMVLDALGNLVTINDTGKI